MGGTQDPVVRDPLDLDSDLALSQQLAQDKQKKNLMVTCKNSTTGGKPVPAGAKNFVVRLQSDSTGNTGGSHDLVGKTMGKGDLFTYMIPGASLTKKQQQAMVIASLAGTPVEFTTSSSSVVSAITFGHGVGGGK